MARSITGPGQQLFAVAQVAEALARAGQHGAIVRSVLPVTMILRRLRRPRRR